MTEQFGQFIRGLERRMSNTKIWNLRKKENELIRKLDFIREERRKLIEFVQKLEAHYDQGLIKGHEYHETLKQKKPHHWIKHHTKVIRHYEKHLTHCKNNLNKEQTKLTQTKIINPLLVFLFITTLISIGWFLGPAITGLTIVENNNVYETGYIETDGWTRVTFTSTYTTPIVIANPREGFETSADSEVATAVIANVTSTGFDVQLYIESTSIAGNVSYMVVENGSWLLDNGMVLQAGKFENVDYYDANADSDSAYKVINFHDPYTAAPVVVASPQKDSAQDWVATRYDVGSLTTSSIEISLELDNEYGNAPVAASGVGTGENNEIGWIAINATSATNMEAALEVDVDEDPATADWRALSFTNTYTEPLFFGLGEEDGGTDPTTVGINNLASTGVDIRRTEERTDSEQTHATEDTLWFVIESGLGNSAPTPPTEIECDSGSCDITVDASVELNASGSTDIQSHLFTYYLQAALENKTASDDLESGTRASRAEGGGSALGEAGSVDIENFEWHDIQFSNTYTSTPVVIATVVTENAGDDNSLIATIKQVTTSGFNVTICKDSGSATCDTSAAEETLNYFVFDVDQESSYSWLDIGTTTIQPNGGSNTVNWDVTFANTPYVFATTNTYNQNGNVAATIWVDGISTTSATKFIGCTHQGTADACDSSTPSETFGYVAIDVASDEITGLQSGSADISNSDWTAVSFSPSYTNPAIMVLQNDDDGGQDPQYPWARSLTTTGADIRYCEQDAGNVCHSHTSEWVMWFAVEQGDINVDGAGSNDDEEANKDWNSYSDTSAEDWEDITDINVTVYVSVYNNSGSSSASNNNPDLELEMYDGSSYISVGNFSTTGTGWYEQKITDSGVISGWLNSTNSDLRIRAVNFDYADASNIDELNFTEVYVSVNGTQWVDIGNHTVDTTLTWDTSVVPEQGDINLRARASEVDSSTNSEWYIKECSLDVSHTVGNSAPTINFVSTIPPQSITEAATSPVELSFLASDSNGAHELDNSSIYASFSLAGEDTRFNNTCIAEEVIDSTTINYTCTIDLWYWDNAGDWDINITINDTEGEYAENSSTTFTLGETSAMVMYPGSLGWTTLYGGDTNTLSTSNPITINNTGNKDITSGNVRVTAYNLLGEEDSDHSIDASQFSVNINSACEGDALTNNTAVSVTSSILNAGNLTAGVAKEELYFCLEEVPSAIKSQSYSTPALFDWIIDII